MSLDAPLSAMIASQIVQALLHVWICPPAFSATCGVLVTLYAVIVVSILPRSIVARLQAVLACANLIHRVRVPTS